MQIPRSVRRSLQTLGPYPSLFLLGVPLAIVEPLKLAAVFVAGDGHWLAGMSVMICSYAVSLFVTERLFIIVKPKLLTLPWFAAIWKRFVAIRDKTFGWLRSTWMLGRRALREDRFRAKQNNSISRRIGTRDMSHNT